MRWRKMKTRGAVLGLAAVALPVIGAAALLANTGTVVGDIRNETASLAARARGGKSGVGTRAAVSTGRRGSAGAGPASHKRAGSPPRAANKSVQPSFYQTPVRYSNEVIVLMYHAIDTRPIPGDVITPGVFAQELALFRQQHFNPITYDQFCQFVSKGSPVPPNAVLITFDNGYESFYRTAYPLLLHYHEPAVLFPIVSWLQHPGMRGIFHTLTWPQVEQMHKSGLIAVQSQTYNMHSGVPVGPGESEAATVGRVYNAATGERETTAQYDRRVLSDLVKARTLVAQQLHERDVDGLSYPFGDYQPSLIQLLHKAGYHYLFTAKQGWGVLRTTSPNTLFRINSGTPNITPQGLMGTITWIAHLTHQSPGWKAPSQFIQLWKY